MVWEVVQQRHRTLAAQVPPDTPPPEALVQVQVRVLVLPQVQVLVLVLGVGQGEDSLFEYEITILQKFTWQQI